MTPTGSGAATNDRIVVLGGSIAGLATALFLSRRGLPVHVLDQDDALCAPSPVTGPPPESERGQPRRATPQAAQSHAFIALAREVLLDEAPDVLDALTGAGVQSIRLADALPPAITDRGQRPHDDDLVVMAARRTTFELVLRQVLRRDRLATFEPGVRAEGLVVDRSGPVPVVRGVLRSSGPPLAAGLVVDASGRRTPVPGWLAAEDVTVSEQEADCGITYHSRFYRLAPGQAGGELNRGYTAGSSFDRYSCLVFPGDRPEADGEGQSFSVTFGTLPEDRELRGLGDAAAFDAAVRSIPLVAPWVNGARPLSEVRSMTGMRNRVRRTATAAGPGVPGLVAIGDAAATTNPAHTRGTSLALAHARALARAVDRELEPADLVAAMADVVERELVPWVHDSAAQDAARLGRWRPEWQRDDVFADLAVAPRLTNGEASVAAQADRDVWSRFTRLQNCLTLPMATLDDDTFVARVRSVQATGWRPDPIPAPSHDEMAELVAARRRGRERAVATGS